jgi:hypothetical protein
MTSLLAGRAALLSVTSHTDPRGKLASLDFSGLGFAAVRAFTVTAPDGAIRGGHAHRRGRQILMRVAGTIEVELRVEAAVQHVTLIEDAPALLIEPGVWARQTYRGADAALVVLSDTPYDPDDYLNDAP